MHPFDALKDLFADLDPDQPMNLEAIYAPTIRFEDPFHRLDGLPALRAYFERLNRQLRTCRFEYTDELRDGSTGTVRWKMTLELRRGLRHPIRVDGTTWAKWADRRLTFQRDYFDAGQMVYEHVPGLGALLRAIKSRM